jgi:hypothetical protein
LWLSRGSCSSSSFVRRLSHTRCLERPAGGSLKWRGSRRHALACWTDRERQRRRLCQAPARMSSPDLAKQPGIRILDSLGGCSRVRAACSRTIRRWIPLTESYGSLSCSTRSTATLSQPLSSSPTYCWRRSIPDKEAQQLG